MTDNARPSAEQDAVAAPKRAPKSNVVIVLIVVALFIGLAFGKLMTGNGSTASAPTSGIEPAGTTITSARNDAVADYEAALKTGKPIYLLFHSLS